MDTLAMRKLFDPHVHFRVESIMEAVSPLVAQCCQAAIGMGNLKKPIRTGAQAFQYAQQIEEACGGPAFRAYPSVMLADSTKPGDVMEWCNCGVKLAKLMFRGTTTGSELGVSIDNIEAMYPVFAEMARIGIPLSGHWEKPGADPMTAESKCLPPFRMIVDAFPNLRIVFEHVSTAEAIDAVLRCGPNVTATITPQHLWMTAEDVTAEKVFDQNGVIRYPHNWCRPPMKTADDREALRVAAMGGNPKFYLGSDFAPHHALAKQGDKPAAGVANYPVVLSLLATLFEQYGRLGQLEAFTSTHAARFYDIELRDETITLERKPFTVPGYIPLLGTDGSDPTQRIIPWLAGAEFPWSLAA